MSTYVAMNFIYAPQKYECMYECTNVCMYVYMYVCMYMYGAYKPVVDYGPVLVNSGNSGKRRL